MGRSTQASLLWATTHSAVVVLAGFSVAIVLTFLLTGTPHPGVAGLIGLAVAAASFLQSTRVNLRGSWLGLLVSGLLATWLLWLCHFTPVPHSRMWDGANHIYLLRWLETFGSPPSGDSPVGPSWGGDLRGYQWAFHATVATIAALLNVDATLVIQPLLLLMIMVTSIHLAGEASYALLTGPTDSHVKRWKPLAISLVFCFVMLPTLVGNYWTQTSGTCFLILAAMKAHRRAFDHASLYTAASFVTHPIPGSLAVGMLVLMCLRGMPRKGLAAVALTLLAITVYIAPHIQGHVYRLLHRDGASLLEISNPLLIGVGLLGLFTCAGMRPIVKHPLGVLAMIASLISIGVWGVGATQYWTAKFGFLASTLGVLGAIASWSPTRGVGRTLGSVALSAALLYNIRLLPSGRYQGFDPDLVPARAVAAASCNRIFIYDDPYFAVWAEAVLFPAPVSLPSTQRALTRRCNHTICDPAIADHIEKHAGPGDCILSRRFRPHSLRAPIVPLFSGEAIALELIQPTTR